MEEAFPQITDAFAIPYRELERRREYLTDKEAGPEFWESPEGQSLRAERDRIEKERRTMRNW